MKNKIFYENAGYYLTGLIILAILGFWDSYFSKFFNATLDYNFYFHFHAFIALLWILLIIVQPILIKKKMVIVHKKVGRLSYLMIGLVFVSVLLLMHNRHSVDENNLGVRLFVPFKDLIVLGVAYAIAIYFKNNVAVHSRAMIASGMVFIEPALIRFINTAFDNPPYAYRYTILIVYTIILLLIFIERKQKKGRWVFPLILIMYMIIHGLLIFDVPLGIMEVFGKWFLNLPLT